MKYILLHHRVLDCAYIARLVFDGDRSTYYTATPVHSFRKYPQFLGRYLNCTPNVWVRKDLVEL